jgi:hypothetical protein
VKQKGPAANSTTGPFFRSVINRQESGCAERSDHSDTLFFAVYANKYDAQRAALAATASYVMPGKSSLNPAAASSFRPSLSSTGSPFHSRTITRPRIPADAIR